MATEVNMKTGTNHMLVGPFIKVGRPSTRPLSKTLTWLLPESIDVHGVCFLANLLSGSWDNGNHLARAHRMANQVGPFTENGRHGGDGLLMRIASPQSYSRRWGSERPRRADGRCTSYFAAAPCCDSVHAQLVPTEPG